MNSCYELEKKGKKCIGFLLKIYKNVGWNSYTLFIIHSNTFLILCYTYFTKSLIL